MTGEITLRGRVLPIGGLKEKILAAHRGNIAHVIVPQENEKDLKEIPDKILNALKITLVDHMDDVLKSSLALDDPESFMKGGTETGTEPGEERGYYPEESSVDIPAN
jgi:ATP-dependent Lon protease